MGAETKRREREEPSSSKNGNGRRPWRTVGSLRLLARRGPSTRLVSERDHPALVELEVLGPVAAKTSTNVGGKVDGKITGLPLTLTVALEGEPMVTREFPVICSDLC